MLQLVLLWTVLLQAPPQTLPSPVRIQGVTFDDATGKPIAGVTVRIPAIFGAPTGVGLPPVSRRPVRAESSADGTFILEVPEPGPHDIYAEKDGYESWKISLSLDEERRGVNVIFKLVPLPVRGVVTGRAVDAAGRPIVGTTVQLLGYSRMSQFSLGAYAERPEFSVVERRDTDDRGEFRLIDIPPGEYFLRVPPAGKPSEELSPLHAAFYPGVTGLTRAKKFEVRPGEEVRLGDIVLAPSTLKPILVRTIDATGGNAVGGPSIALLGGPAVDPPATTGLVDGVPAIRPDEPGNYMVCTSKPYRVETPTRFVHGQNACADIVYTGDLLDITLTIRKSVASLTGRVLLEESDGAPPVPMAGVGIGGVGVGYGANYGGTSDANGFFRNAYPIPDGPVRMRFLTTPAGYYVASIHQGQRNALEEGVLVAGEDTNLDVRVRKGVGSVAGVVAASDGKPVDRATIVLIPEGSLARRADKDNTHGMATTNLNGTFEIRNIIPGNYRAYALATIEDGAHLDASVFKPFEEQSTPVEISKDAPVSLQLKLISSRE